MARPPAALVLDFGGVISRTLFETHAESERALGLPPGSLAWRGPFDPAGDPPWQAMQAGRISERDYWMQRTAETGRLVGAVWTAIPQFLRRVRGADPMSAIRPEAVAAIRAAKAAGLRLAILSNELDLFYGPEFRVGLPFLAAFDLIVDATHTGILKPDPRAYAAVTAGLGLPAAECLFVDDQPRNVAGARAAGMQALAFDVTDAGGSWARVRAALGLSLGEPADA
jgi:putative hydrolase of the HAD superfamily